MSRFLSLLGLTILTLSARSASAGGQDPIDVTLRPCNSFTNFGSIARVFNDKDKRFKVLAPAADVNAWKDSRDKANAAIGDLKQACDAEKAAATQTGPVHDAHVKALKESGTALNAFRKATNQLSGKMTSAAQGLENLEERSCSSALRLASKLVQSDLTEKTGRQGTVCQGLAQ